MKFMKLAVDECPKCGFDMDAYNDKGVTVHVCCMCEHTIRLEYYCVICGEWFDYDPDHEPHSTEDGEDCHEECCPFCNKEEK